MKKKVLASAMLFIIIFGILFFYHYKKHRLYPENALNWLTRNEALISHAGGGLWETSEDGSDELVTYSNSREALERSIANGYHVIEFDLMMTTDGDLACTHNWPEEDGIAAMSTEQWRDYKVNGRYTSLFFQDVLERVKECKDIYIITDTKSEHSIEETRAEFRRIYDQALEIGGTDLADRIIPQIYNMEMYAVVKDIYQSPQIIYTLYTQDDVPDEEIISFVSDKKDIPVVVLPKRRLEETFLEELHDVGKYTYSHTFDNLKKLKKYFKMGVDGFFTNAILPSELKEVYENELDRFACPFDFF